MGMAHGILSSKMTAVTREHGGGQSGARPKALGDVGPLMTGDRRIGAFWAGVKFSYWKGFGEAPGDRQGDIPWGGSNSRRGGAKGVRVG